MISPTEKRALRRLQADQCLRQGELAKQIGVTDKTLRLIINNDEPQKINNTTYQKIMRAIAENY